MMGLITPLLLLFLTVMISSIEGAPKEKNDKRDGGNGGAGVRIKYSVRESRSSTSSSSQSQTGPPTVRNSQLPFAESTLPHAPVLREMNESDQHDMSTSTPSSESLESQLQSPHVIRKKALVDFDTSSDDLLQTLEVVQ